MARGEKKFTSEEEEKLKNSETSRRDASNWIKKLINKSQHSPPALIKNGFDASYVTETGRVSRQRKDFVKSEGKALARGTTRSTSPSTSPARNRIKTAAR